VNNGLILLANNHLELVNPVCPRCGSDLVTKQYIEIDGKRAYRLAVFDPLLNVPVTEEIAANIEYNTNF
jgi:hypothetical protein